MPASIFDLPLDALCQRLDYLSDWFVTEHVALVDDARRRAMRIDSSEALRSEELMIRGLHAMFYSSQAREMRAFLRDKLGLRGNDVGDGWLIFDAPEADLGVHPTDDSSPASGTADISFYCDDIAATVRELEARGVEFTKGIEDHGYGLVTYINVPGGFEVQLYQPKYSK